MRLDMRELATDTTDATEKRSQDKTKDLSGLHENVKPTAYKQLKYKINKTELMPKRFHLKVNTQYLCINI